MTNPFWPELSAAFGIDPARYRETQDGGLTSAFRVTDLAAASIGVAGAALSHWCGGISGRPAQVDRRYASFWFGMSIRPQGWNLPPPWDPIAGDYRTRNGWIRLHTNAPHHRQAALSVLGPHDNREQLARTVAGWDGAELEEAIVAVGGCAAVMHDMAQWAAHPQGQAVASEPLLHETLFGCDSAWKKKIYPARPLAGIRVLDLTRVLAGPVASRFLAAYGADVLRIDPPRWEEPGVVPEVTLGKRCAGLDLHARDDRAIFETLLSTCDVFLHGYRADALVRLGFDDEAVRGLNPGLVDVALNAYGWSGPWASRRGFDSLVQMSCGIAASGMDWADAQQPTPLPVQALDHATGYFLAAAVIKGLRARQQGQGYRVRLSLARTAKLLMDHRAVVEPGMPGESEADIDPTIEQTQWGPARRVRFPLTLAGVPARWERAAAGLRSSPPCW